MLGLGLGLKAKFAALALWTRSWPWPWHCVPRPWLTICFMTKWWVVLSQKIFKLLTSLTTVLLLVAIFVQMCSKLLHEFVHTFTKLINRYIASWIRLILLDILCCCLICLQGGLLMWPHMATMSDKLLEVLAFLKCNILNQVVCRSQRNCVAQYQ